MAEEKEAELYTPGDLIWGKLDRWAYWPCLVTYCPSTGTFVKFGLDKSKPEQTESTLISYHVQYFGNRVYYGWTTFGNINCFPFLGLQDYMDKLEVWKLQALDEDPEVRKLAQSYVRRLTVADKHKAKGWEAAVKEAEEALKYDCKVTRFSSLVYQFKAEQSSKEKCDGSDNSKENSLIGTECYICQVNLPDITCSLACGKSYHLECLGLKRKPKVAFRCVSCMADTKCRMCDGNEGVTKCSLSTCPTYFHEKCLAKFVYLRKEQNLCPNHLCFMCAQNNPQSFKSAKGTQLLCIECPMAFHNRESCVPPGSNFLGKSKMLCSKHFSKEDQLCHISTCLKCNKDGELIECKSCPVALHRSCYSMECIPHPAEDFVCDQCKQRKYLQNGQLIMGRFEMKWWPGKIIPPSERPVFMKDKERPDGEFVVYYYGVKRFCWANAGCVYPYELAQIIYPNRIRKMLDDETLEVIAETYADHLLDESIKNIRHTFRSIRENYIVSPVEYGRQSGRVVEECTCDKSDPCTPDSNCLNRCLKIECSSSCKIGELCQNQRFKKKQYAATKVIYSKFKGYGLAADEAIEEGAFVIEYVGEVITREEYHVRYAELQKDKTSKYYFLEIDSKRLIDAGPKGNMSRFINHSCQPNCIMKKWWVNKDTHIGIFSIKPIAAGEELTFNYRFVAEIQQCYCRAEECKGYIGFDTWKAKFNKLPKIKLLNMNLTEDNYLVKDSRYETYLDKNNQVQRAIYVFKELNIAVLPAEAKCIEISSELKDNPTETDPTESIHNEDPTETNAMEFILNADPTETDESIHEKEQENMDTACFVCKKPGNIMCNKEGCCKYYDDQCARLQGTPEGDWTCMVHKCCICKKESSVHCITCPTSFCAKCWYREVPESYQCEICRIKHLNF
ncbi:hypothetical protein JTE90_017976 [Oedothorax gibbosus]|uniref:Histone-lysine N-methyltransferase n=1 Tax=Oedothorax gibbosus TaxID=931172 RepID=A0AAV6V9Y7_9ARAC|nr:hypothetical protein JTE90_017976 [Oedothorax gibbosus]